MADSPELQQLLDSLMHPELEAIDLSLDRIESYLAQNGRPHDRLPPVVHVAGTNGKGSTIAFLRAVLEASGYLCHVFTSPHLVHFRERIVVAGRESTDAELMPILERVRERSNEFPLTFFEANTVAAFELFAEHPADVVLLEVGMGGRYDATNVIPHSALSVITPVSYDHQEFLGTNLSDIAYEKAGILKPDGQAVIAPQQPQAAERIAQVVRDMNCVAEWVNAPLPAHHSLGLEGGHQRINAAVAVAAAEKLQQSGFGNINENTIALGLMNARWRGRLQRLSAGELHDVLTKPHDMWLDGGHNADAAARLAEWARAQPEPVHLVIGMAKHKDAHAFFRSLNDSMESVTLLDLSEHDWAMPIQQLEQAAWASGVATSTVGSTVQAVRLLSGVETRPHVNLLIAGSLYLAGLVLEKNS